MVVVVGCGVVKFKKWQVEQISKMDYVCAR